MSEYGVRPTGFVVKPLGRILDEIEQSLVTEFGPGIIQTPQSPMGQINGLFADMTSGMWELAEDVYQSIDPDQAEGANLDRVGRIRLTERGPGEQDGSYRQAITNEGTARVILADLARAVQNVDGVRYRQVFVNETSTNDENQMPPNTIAVAVLGGDDAEIATVINRYIPMGISTYGGLIVNIIEEGYCRSVRLIRPVEMDVRLTVQITASANRRGCPAPSPSVVAAALAEYLVSPETRPWNGQNIDAYLIRQFIESTFDGVEFVGLFGYKDEFTDPFYNSIPFEFFEIANVTEVTVVPG
ncbi:hypothetical protein FPY71_10015 [Aureimonas fodinaquatilis]|uniref:Baseplate protein J-like domain-containing protein n=1 Tax=Aureimonas fodinaquatilis TaxID=2565783 RepID=A0A5B0DYF9_9HYPH|nr:hypothetical protein [Aureimonas fodinaquatilis]KAA0970801.1 hypothetical protein FPY71_10015 [Aureimonas fodinaquatilis]